MEVQFQINGLKETLALFNQLQDEIGDKKARSKVLIPAVKLAMKPVLAMAKSLVPKDTGALRDSLVIVGRRPSNKDKKSKYIVSNDSVIAIVTTKPVSRKQFKATMGMKKKEMRKYFEAQGSFYDARAIANEFGTSKRPAKPFMRVSLESKASSVATQLGVILKQKIEQYRSKNI